MRIRNVPAAALVQERCICGISRHDCIRCSPNSQESTHKMCACNFGTTKQPAVWGTQESIWFNLDAVLDQKKSQCWIHPKAQTRKRLASEWFCCWTVRAWQLHIVNEGPGKTPELPQDRRQNHQERHQSYPKTGGKTTRTDIRVIPRQEAKHGKTTKAQSIGPHKECVRTYRCSTADFF